MDELDSTSDEDDEGGYWYVDRLEYGKAECDQYWWSIMLSGFRLDKATPDNGRYCIAIRRQDKVSATTKTMFCREDF